MNNIDLIILGILLASGLIGLLRGFVREILSILTWVGAAALTYYLFYKISFFRDFVHGHIASQQIADGVAIAVLFIASLIILSIICGVLSDLVSRSNLNGIDRSLGLCFGLFRGVVLIAICEIILSAFIPRQNQPQSVQTARLTPFARQMADKLLELLPSRTKSYILSQSAKTLTTLTLTAPRTESQTPAVVPHEHESQVPDQSTQPREILPRPKPGAGESEENGSAALSSNMDIPPPHAILPPLPGTSQGQQAAPNQTPIPQDAQKTAEALALLKPQVAGERKNEGSYDQSQRHDMDRLFQTAQ